MPRSATRKADKPVTTGAMHDETPRRRTVPAGKAGRPHTTAAASVFDVARGQAKTGTKRMDLIDPDAVPILKGRPLPPLLHIVRGSRYRRLLDRMGPGDCVELPINQARALRQYAVKHGTSCTLRQLNDTTAGVWRDPT